MEIGLFSVLRRIGLLVALAILITFMVEPLMRWHITHCVQVVGKLLFCNGKPAKPPCAVRSLGYSC
jgi:hypothetical protein